MGRFPSPPGVTDSGRAQLCPCPLPASAPAWYRLAPPGPWSSSTRGVTGHVQAATPRRGGLTAKEPARGWMKRQSERGQAEGREDRDALSGGSWHGWATSHRDQSDQRLPRFAGTAAGRSGPKAHAHSCPPGQMSLRTPSSPGGTHKLGSLPDWQEPEPELTPPSP